MYRVHLLCVWWGGGEGGLHSHNTFKQGRMKRYSFRQLQSLNCRQLPTIHRNAAFLSIFCHYFHSCYPPTFASYPHPSSIHITREEKREKLLRDVILSIGKLWISLSSCFFSFALPTTLILLRYIGNESDTFFYSFYPPSFFFFYSFYPLFSCWKGVARSGI